MTGDWNGRVCSRVRGQVLRRVCKDVPVDDERWENYDVAHFGGRRLVGYTTRALPSAALDPFICTR